MRTGETKIRKAWSAHGLDCLLLEDSHPCGYVRVPKSHPWHEKDYTDQTDGPLSPDNWDSTIEAKVSVHGGITYAGERPHRDCVVGWWFGFDCAHAGDAFAGMSGKVWSLQELVVETEMMAEQIAGFRGTDQ